MRLFPIFFPGILFFGSMGASAPLMDAGLLPNAPPLHHASCAGRSCNAENKVAGNAADQQYCFNQQFASQLFRRAV